MVGTYCTGEGRYGPRPRASGMHDGTAMNGPPCDHSASLKLSHPQPGPFPNWDGVGLSPWKPSMVAAARAMCPVHVGVARNSNVRSEMTKDRASAAALGICDGLNWE